jgi:hypothetical protein
LIGIQAGLALANGESNVIIGQNSGTDVTSGSQNTFVGFSSGRGIITGANNTIIGNATGLSSSLSNTIILADGQGNQRLYINSSGNVGIATTNPATYRLDVNGTFRATSNGYFGAPVSVNSTTSPSNVELYVVANAPASRIRYQNTNTNGESQYQILNDASTVAYFSLNGTTAATLPNEASIGSTGVINVTGSIVKINTNSLERARITNAGRLLLGTTTESTYLLDVNGTARVSGNVTINGPSATITTVDIFGGSAGGAGQTLRLYGTTPNSQGLFLTYSTSSAESFIDAAFHTTGSANAFGDIVFRSKKNATNTLAENMRIRGFDGNVLIGTSTNNASAIVNISSTTKGFLPPRMTTTQKNAISSPAAGLVVYDTTLGKLCVYTTAWETITSA